MITLLAIIGGGYAIYKGLVAFYKILFDERNMDDLGPM